MFYSCQIVNPKIYFKKSVSTKLLKQIAEKKCLKQVLLYKIQE